MNRSAGSSSVESLANQKFLEDDLDMRVRDALPIMQARIIDRTTYFGIRTLKNPLDFWVYQELIFAQHPDVIVEIGNLCGGTLLALAHVCDRLNKGRVIGVDIDQKEIASAARAHPRILLIEGDAVEKVSNVRDAIGGEKRVLVIEDSSHTYDNTLAVLRAYAGLVSPGSYFIVEDGNCHHGLDLGPFPGPYEAVTEFMRDNSQFVIDRTCESFFITWNPRGYLRRIE